MTQVTTADATSAVLCLPVFGDARAPSVCELLLLLLLLLLFFFFFFFFFFFCSPLLLLLLLPLLLLLFLLLLLLLLLLLPLLVAFTSGLSHSITVTQCVEVYIDLAVLHRLRGLHVLTLFVS